jgi:hypothetical protein
MEDMKNSGAVAVSFSGWKNVGQNLRRILLAALPSLQWQMP